MSKKEIKLIKCWEHFKCEHKSCPSYKSSDLCCWIQNNTFCHNSSQEMWLDKMEICVDCEVLKTNIKAEHLNELIKFTSKQFKGYKEKINKEHKELLAAQKELRDFKISSVYLLKELNEKNIKITLEKKDLSKILTDKSKKLNDIEKKYIQSVKMVTMGKFSAGIAHEINNPLGAVINYIRMVLANPQVAGQNKGYLELAFKGLFRIEKIIKDILNYSGSKKPSLAIVDISKLLNEAIAFVQHRYEKKKIKIVFRMPKEKLNAFVDSFQINQMLINILNNSIDAIESEGKILIKAHLEGKYIKIKIKDNGMGIAPELLDEIFNPFFTTKDVGKGSGMGLFVCYNIINLNNSAIDIKSEPGKGTTVYVSLPAAEKDEK